MMGRLLFGGLSSRPSPPKAGNPVIGLDGKHEVSPHASEEYSEFLLPTGFDLGISQDIGSASRSTPMQPPNLTHHRRRSGRPEGDPKNLASGGAGRG